MAFISIEELSKVACKKDYVETENDCYCECGVDDSEHLNRMTGDRRGVRMWKMTRESEIAFLNRHNPDNVLGGVFLCEHCYELLPVNRPGMGKVTRRTLRLPAKPPCVRAVPS